MNEETFQTIDRWLARGDAVATATVVRTFRSAPRPLASVFAVSSTGEMAGSVSGGCVEGALVAESLELLAGDGEPRLRRFGVSDELAGEAGLACGGDLWVYVERFHPRPSLRRGAIALRASGPGAGGRVVHDEDAGTREGTLDPLATEAAEEAIPVAIATRRSRCIELEDGGLLFVESVAPAPRMVVVGAVDTTEALCRYAQVLGWRTVVVDPRAAFATRERIPSADELHVAWPDDVYPQLGLEPADAVVVLTHDAKIDDPAIALALEAGAGYVGALGSRRTQASRRERLVQERGIAQADADRVHGPVGLDLGGETPQETALAIAAEIVAWRGGRTGVSLAATSGRIHRTDEPEPALA